MRSATFAQGNRAKRSNESGSASVEFVILAIPLFLPIFIFLTQFAELSNSQAHARTLVREVVRAYVASSNLSDAQERSFAVLNYGARQLGFTSSEIDSMTLTFTCSSPSCLQPGQRVKAELRLKAPLSHRQIQVSAQEYVSPWQ